MALYTTPKLPPAMVRHNDCDDDRTYEKEEYVLPSSSSTWYCDAAPSSAMVVEQQSKSVWTKDEFGVQEKRTFIGFMVST